MFLNINKKNKKVAIVANNIKIRYSVIARTSEKLKNILEKIVALFY